MKRNPSVLLAALCTALLLLSAGHAQAQANAKPPTQLTYQGFLTDANGVPFGSAGPVNKTVIFRIYDVLSGGTTANLKWSSQQVVTVDKGYFSVLLGQGSSVGSEPFSADLTGVFAGSSTASDRYLELQADGTTIAPRLRFLPAPYAVLAKSATDLVDPVTGASSLSIAGGNLSVGGSLNVSSVTASGNVTAAGFSGSGANLTALNGSQITSGTLANARTTAASANTANAIVARDGAGNFSAGTITANTFSGSGASLTSLNASQVSSGTLDNTRTTATSANTANAIVARDGSGNIAAGQVVANSFKITGTSTMILSAISRGSVFSTNPVAGITATFAPNNRVDPDDPGVTRKNVNDAPNTWWKSTNTTYGVILYTATIVVPAGEFWEVAYKCSYTWATDDAGAIIWTLNDALLDDSITSAQSPYNFQIYQFDQEFLLPAGTHVVRVKGVIGSGSNNDAIYFPARIQPSHVLVRKYKSN